MSGGVTVIKIDNPPFNALTRDVRLKLKAALQSAIDNPVCKVILLVGDGKSFSVGADIKELATPFPLGAERDAMAAYVSAYNSHNVSNWYHRNRHTDSKRRSLLQYWMQAIV